MEGERKDGGRTEKGGKKERWGREEGGRKETGRRIRIRVLKGSHHSWLITCTYEGFIHADKCKTF